MRIDRLERHFDRLWRRLDGLERHLGRLRKHFDRLTRAQRLDETSAVEGRSQALIGCRFSNDGADREERCGGEENHQSRRGGRDGVSSLRHPPRCPSPSCPSPSCPSPSCPSPSWPSLSSDKPPNFHGLMIRSLFQTSLLSSLTCPASPLRSSGSPLQAIVRVLRMPSLGSASCKNEVRITGSLESNYLFN